VTSLILQTASRLLQPLMLFVSVFLLVRGHHQPGGGFVGGLVAAAAYGLQSMAFGVRAARATLRLQPRSLIGWGLALALATALFPLLFGRPLLTSLWVRAAVPGLGDVDVGTPLAFDLGVYLLVAGAALSILFSLEEE
jgi:multicomponent Na+:H+ antiporter subunit B